MNPDDNKLKFIDPTKPDVEVVLFYRDLTVDDWIGYWADMAPAGDETPDKKERLKRLLHTHFEVGKNILTGFSATGALDSVSMDDPAWKEKLISKIPQFLIVLGQTALGKEDLVPEKNF